MVSHKNFPSAGAEEQLRELGIKLPAPPEPFGTYAEAVQTGNLVFVTGMLFYRRPRGSEFLEDGLQNCRLTKYSTSSDFF
jgi:hypothetical protein